MRASKTKAVIAHYNPIVGFLVNKQRLFVVLLLWVGGVTTLRAELPEWWQQAHNYNGVSDWNSYMKYTAAYFGPNALPVPELSDGTISLKHRAEMSADVFWGFGDQTQSLSSRFTYVFIPGRLAITGSGVFLEHYKTTNAVRDYRASMVESAQETFLIGDYYISTQMALLRETACKPGVSLDIMLKTASSETSAGARYFDTPGYAFRLATGKTWVSRTSLVDSIRFAANLGFLCYQLNNRNQNDALLFGALLCFYHGNLALEGGIGGYSGWIGGDKPLVLRAKLSWKRGSMNYFMGYQHALRDYPFRRLQTGLAVDF